jgi:hypothetical protein
MIMHQKVYFAANKTGLWKTDEDTEMTEQISTAKHMLIHCMPLTAIILSLDITNIDFFNLDARGEEFEILSSINFEQINIKVCALFLSARRANKLFVSAGSSCGYFS